MQCFCCEREFKITRKVKLRSGEDFDIGDSPDADAPREERWAYAEALRNSPAWKSYVEDQTYRWAFICMQCYRTLDNESGLAEIAGRRYNIACASRFDRAAVVNQAKYDKFQREEARKLGLE